MFVLLSFLSNTGSNFVIGLLLARFLGPDQYGRFALAVALAVGVQTIAFDWARVAATRFYSERASRSEPQLRGTLDASLAGLAAIVLVCGIVVAWGVRLPLSPAVVGLAAGLAVVNGLFDYWTALIRARFLDRTYARLILVKNLASAVITLGGAWWFGTTFAAMAGIGAAMLGGALTARADLRAPSGSLRLAEARIARTLLGYAVPVVTANLLYQTIPLADRLLIARAHGFAPSGQFSLAYDIGLRVVAAVGSALDVLLFQIAVRADEMHGTSEAKRQIGRNIGVVIAILLPACTGLWIVLPSFEAVVVPPEFRGPFAADLRLLLPGLFCYGLIFFAAHPLFQIQRRTLPLVAAGAVAAATNLAILAVRPAGAAEAAEAQGLSLALALALLWIWGRRTSPVWTSGRDLLGAAGSTLAMAGVCGLLPAVSPGPAALVLQAGVGTVVYGSAAWVLDLCGCRRQLKAALRSRRS